MRRKYDRKLKFHQGRRKFDYSFYPQILIKLTLKF